MDIIKQPSERVPFRINFSNWFQTGEEIDTVSILLDGEVPVVPGFIYSYSRVDANRVQATLDGGVDGETHTITFVVVTTLGNTFEYDVSVIVRENTANVYVDAHFSYRLKYDEDDLTLYILPSPDSHFANNTEYTVVISSGLYGVNSSGVRINPLASPYTFTFTGPYCPIFSTLTRIKLLTGPVADAMYDDTIYRMIYKNTLDIVELYNDYTGETYDASYYCANPTTVPSLLKRYVECKTAFDILGILDALASDSMNQLKTLGDMTIKYSPAIGSADVSKKKQLYDCWNQIIANIRSLALGVAVRGWNDVSKGYAHPVREPHHNRIVRPVDFRNSQPDGPWARATDWRGFE